jgi:hypothetical protein
MTIQDVLPKAEALEKKSELLLRFEKLVKTTGHIQAILDMWGQIPEEWLEPMNFWSWLTLWEEAPNTHPLKSLAPERMADLATNPEEWDIVYRKARPYSDLAERAERMSAKLRAEERARAHPGIFMILKKRVKRCFARLFQA